MRPEPVPAREEAPRVVGQALPHDSAAKHVSGTALYIDDVAEPAGTLHVAPGLARVAHGVVKRLDLAAVRAAPGVVAVLTADDIPGANDVSPVMGDDPMFATDKVEFYGQVLFAVVATTRDQARRAAVLAAVEIEPLPALLTVDDALAAGADLSPPYSFGRGDAPAAVAQGAVQIAGVLRIGGQEHFYLEGQIAFAFPGEDGTVRVLSSTQHPSEVQHVVARVLALPDAAVVCETRRMGGGFGGKESQATQWAAIAALAARVTGRPCKMRLDRDDDMVATGKRHDFRVDYAVGADADGRITGVSVDFAARCGYSHDLSNAIVDRAMFHADNGYFYPAVHVGSRRLKTHTVSNTAFRGFGGPQGMVAAERLIDRIAWATGRDPLDVRKANLYGPGRDVTPYGMAVEDNVLPGIIETLEATSDYRRRRVDVIAFNRANRFLKRGLALTPVKFGISFTTTFLNQAGALVHVYQDGSVMLNHGGTEMGQGLFIKVAQVVAEVFGIGLDRVMITATATDKVPNTSPTAASSGSDMNGMAAKRAAETIRDRLAAFAAPLLGTVPERVRFAEGRVHGETGSLSFGDLVKKAYLGRVSLSATGFYVTPKIGWNRAEGTGRPFFYFAYGAACAEAVIDTLTGETKVTRVDILHDVGRSLNPAIDIGQIEGGFVQGMGWLTAEELVFDGAGRLATHAPSTYKIPTASDVPADFRVTLFANENREDTVWRSKAVGEPPLMLATSVWCAIADAVHALNPGRPVALDAPATPEAVLRAVMAQQQAGA